MGLYDHVHIAGPDTRFVCSEGHDLTDEEFQSKCFGCTMGHVTIAGDTMTHDGGGYGVTIERPWLGRFYVYATCRQCPAFVQAETANLVDCGVEFEIEAVDDKIRKVTRLAPTTAEWLVDVPSRTWMRGASGPMPWADAERLQAQMRGYSVDGDES